MERSCVVGPVHGRAAAIAPPSWQLGPEPTGRPRFVVEGNTAFPSSKIGRNSRRQACMIPISSGPRGVRRQGSAFAFAFSASGNFRCRAGMSMRIASASSASVLAPRDPLRLAGPGVVDDVEPVARGRGGGP